MNDRLCNTPATTSARVVKRKPRSINDSNMNLGVEKRVRELRFQVDNGPSNSLSGSRCRVETFSRIRKLSRVYVHTHIRHRLTRFVLRFWRFLLFFRFRKSAAFTTNYIGKWQSSLCCYIAEYLGNIFYCIYISLGVESYSFPLTTKLSTAYLQCICLDVCFIGHVRLRKFCVYFGVHDIIFLSPVHPNVIQDNIHFLLKSFDFEIMNNNHQTLKTDYSIISSISTDHSQLLSPT